MSAAIKVHWTDDERRRFYEAARSFGPPERGDAKEIWGKALALAGVSRRPHGAAALSAMNMERKKGRLPARTEPARTEPARTEPARTEPARTEPAPDDAPEPCIADMVVSSLLQVLYDPRLRKALRDVITEALAPESELEQRQAITWREARTPRERSLRVVLVGGNFAAHASAVGAVVGIDLRFWGEHGESTHRLKALLDGADAAVVVVGGVRHGPMHMVKDRERAGRLRAVYWTQPLSELRGALESMAKVRRDA